MSDDPNVYIHSGQLIQRIAKALLLFLITILLLMPVVVCSIINATSVRIAIVMVSTISYLLVLSSLTKSRTMELILAGATYAGVPFHKTRRLICWGLDMPLSLLYSSPILVLPKSRASYGACGVENTGNWIYQGAAATRRNTHILRTLAFFLLRQGQGYKYIREGTRGLNPIWKVRFQP